MGHGLYETLKANQSDKNAHHYTEIPSHCNSFLLCLLDVLTVMKENGHTYCNVLTCFISNSGNSDDLGGGGGGGVLWVVSLYL